MILALVSLDSEFVADGRSDSSVQAAAGLTGKAGRPGPTNLRGGAR